MTAREQGYARKNKKTKRMHPEEVNSFIHLQEWDRHLKRHVGNLYISYVTALLNSMWPVANEYFAEQAEDNKKRLEEFGIFV